MASVVWTPKVVAAPPAHHHGDVSKGLPMGPCYGPLLDSGGVSSIGPYFVHDI